MPNLNSQVFKMMVVVLFLASCANGNKKNSNSSSSSLKSSRGSASVAQMRSPLSNEKALIQELTGKPVSSLPSQQELKNKPLSTQHYYAGLRAAESKNYIMAIKHFNTVLKKYPNSTELKSAFAAKAKVYKEMGLAEPASLNLRMAQASKVKVLNKKTASSVTVKSTVKEKSTTK